MEIAFTNGVGRFRLMRERIKNLCAYFLVVFNLIVGAVSVYSTATALTGKTIWVIVIIISVLGLCGSIALIVEKAYKPLSDKVEELSEGYITVAEKFSIIVTFTDGYTKGFNSLASAMSSATETALSGHNLLSSPFSAANFALYT